MNFAELKAWVESRPKVKLTVISLYYLAIAVVLILMYGRGDFSTPPFVYQEF